MELQAEVCTPCNASEPQMAYELHLPTKEPLLASGLWSCFARLYIAPARFCLESLFYMVSAGKGQTLLQRTTSRSQSEVDEFPISH